MAERFNYGAMAVFDDRSKTEQEGTVKIGKKRANPLIVPTADTV
jgi:hypothetical protein